MFHVSAHFELIKMKNDSISVEGVTAHAQFSSFSCCFGHAYDELNCFCFDIRCFTDLVLILAMSLWDLLEPCKLLGVFVFLSGIKWILI